VLPWDSDLSGRLTKLTIDSKVLKGNHLGDPHVRPLWVQVPAGYDDDPSGRYPVVYVLMGYGGLLPSMGLRRAYQPTLPESVDALNSERSGHRFITVYLDGWTKYGGSQYIDSPGTGKYHTWLCEEILPFVDGRYRTLADRDHRAVTGKSSGGFGAMVTAMMRPDLFSVFTTHAGDALYEVNYLRDFGTAARALRDYSGDIMAFWHDFESRTPFAKGSDQTLLLFLGIASCFSAEDNGTVRLPFDPKTGRVCDEVWSRWLAWDPVRMLEQPRFAEAMRSMRGIWVDAGKQDDFNLDLGAQAFADGLQSVGVPTERVRFELVDGNHWNITHRYPLAIEWAANLIA